MSFQFQKVFQFLFFAIAHHILSVSIIYPKIKSFTTKFFRVNYTPLLCKFLKLHSPYLCFQNVKFFNYKNILHSNLILFFLFRKICYNIFSLKFTNLMLHIFWLKTLFFTYCDIFFLLLIYNKMSQEFYFLPKKKSIHYVVRLMNSILIQKYGIRFVNIKKIVS